jgi:metallophosphoesterase (TIGR00282 family)
VRLLFIGDIFGSPGRLAVTRHLPALIEERDIDLCIANGENAAAGFGLTREIADQLFETGVDAITGGNHLWDKREILEFIDQEPRIVRPANYPDDTPGAASAVVRSRNGIPVGILNLMGRVFMPAVECPFRTAERLLPELRRRTPIILVDMHAEATSEKVAMGRHLDGRVTAVVGTHTHVQTADACLLGGGTAYITDVGMTGPHDSVIGVRTDLALRRFLTRLPTRMHPAKDDPRLHAVVIDVDPSTGRATGIEAIELAA